ncbi:MAG: zinc-ribbon domain-containing protein [Candidatus Woesearchaeota archaeon]
MGFCNKCGAKLDEKNKFCPACGAKTVAESSGKVKEVKTASNSWGIALKYLSYVLLYGIAILGIIALGRRSAHPVFSTSPYNFLIAAFPILSGSFLITRKKVIHKLLGIIIIIVAAIITSLTLIDLYRFGPI